MHAIKSWNPALLHGDNARLHLRRGHVASSPPATPSAAGLRVPHSRLLPTRSLGMVAALTMTYTQNATVALFIDFNRASANDGLHEDPTRRGAMESCLKIKQTPGITTNWRLHYNHVFLQDSKKRRSTDS